MGTDSADLGNATRSVLLDATLSSLLWALSGGLGAEAQIAIAQPLQAGVGPQLSSDRDLSWHKNPRLLDAFRALSPTVSRVTWRQ